MSAFKGMDEEREWLQQAGFSIGKEPIPTGFNSCDWYAYRMSGLPVRPCDTNDHKVAQIIVSPWLWGSQTEIGKARSFVVSVKGEAKGRWYSLEAYGITPEDYRTNMEEINASLIAAWNALIPEPKEQWECFCDDSYYSMWAVRKVGSIAFAETIHVRNKDEAEGLVKLLSR